MRFGSGGGARRELRRPPLVDTGAPLLSVERLSYSYENKPVELRRGLYHTEAHYYRNELN